MSYRDALKSRQRSGSSRQTMTPQVRPIPAREAEMVRNSAGAMSFTVGPWERLDRFLVLGSDSGSYYASAKKLTLENLDSLVECLQKDGLRVVRAITDISHSGRAPRNDSALLALAVASAWGVEAGNKTLVSKRDRESVIRYAGGDAHGSAQVRRAAFAALPLVARTGTHLMQFAGHMVSLRGWGQAALNGVGEWFTGMDAERLALQAVKYRQRDGWTLRDLLRLSHPKARDANHAALFDWMTHRDLDPDAGSAGTNAFGMPKVRTPRRHALRPTDVILSDASKRFRVVEGFHLVRSAKNAAAAAEVIRSHALPWEAVPTEFLNDVNVWDALLGDMGMTAMVRNLGKMSSVGLLKQGSDASRFVAERLRDEVALKKARVHPIQLLLALKTYASGRGFKGSLNWTPVQSVCDALDEAFYLAFSAVEPTNKRFMLGVDISGSMETSVVANTNLKAREGAGAMALVTYATEPECMAYGFTSSGDGMWNRSGYGLTDLQMSRRERLDAFNKRISRLDMGRTDAGLVIKKALEDKLRVDAFVIYTDNETWSGPAHVTELLKRYRDQSGIPARLVAVGMTATEFSVVDPKDAGQMNVVGFDASTPALISDFVR